MGFFSPVWPFWCWSWGDAPAAPNRPSHDPTSHRAGVIYFTGFLAIDPILGMTFGVVLLAASWGIIRKALSVLMEGAPKGIDLNEVNCRSVDG